jgi:hypothetical protein
MIHPFVAYIPDEYFSLNYNDEQEFVILLVERNTTRDRRRIFAANIKRTDCVDVTYHQPNRYRLNIPQFITQINSSLEITAILPVDDYGKPSVIVMFYHNGLNKYCVTEEIQSVYQINKNVSVL